MFEIKTMKTIYQTGGKVIHQSDGQTLIFDNSTQKISIIDEEYKTVETTDLDIKVEDVALTENNEIIATSRVSTSIMRISRSEGSITLRSLAPKPISGICINKKQEIVIGSGFKLIVYSSDGSVPLNTIQKDETDQDLFIAFVSLVRQTTNEEYLVTSAYEVVCFTKDWILKWRCKLQHGILGLCCDRFNNALVVPRWLNQLTIIDCKNGKIVHCADLHNVDMSQPLSLSVDRKGLLWIGQEHKTTVVSYLKE